MSELNDVTGGETIAAAFTNQVKERTAMRYASQAALDTSIPAPIEGSMAYLQDTNVLQYYDGSNWVALLIVTSAGVDFLRLDLTNDPLSGDLTINGATDNAGLRIKTGSGAGSGGGLQLGATQASHYGSVQGFLVDGGNNSTGQIETHTRRVATDASLTRAFYAAVDGRLIADGGVQINAYKTDEFDFQARDIIARDTPPVGGDGKDGDLFVFYSFSAATTGAEVYVKVGGVWRGQP